MCCWSWPPLLLYSCPLHVWQVIDHQCVRWSRCRCSAAPPHLRLVDGSSLLDIGSGYGSFVFQAAMRRPKVQVTGVEIKIGVCETSQCILRDLQADGFELDNVTIHHGSLDTLEKKIGMNFSHVYAFDYSFNNQSPSGSKDLMEPLAAALRRIPFKTTPTDGPSGGAAECQPYGAGVGGFCELKLKCGPRPGLSLYAVWCCSGH